MLTELDILGELLEDTCIEGLFAGLEVYTFVVVGTNEAEGIGEFVVEIVAIVVGLLLSKVDTVTVPSWLCDNTGVFEPNIVRELVMLDRYDGVCWGLLLSEVWIDGVGFTDTDGLLLLDGSWLGLSELD